MPAEKRRPPAPRRRGKARDWGRVVAMVLCVVFAVVGAVPLALGLLVRTQPVRAWAARETARILTRELGVSARYDVGVQAWPMMVSLENVVVDSSDGGTPFLFVERISARPRPFSLLAGRLDVGDVELVGPRVRVVVEKGEVKNLTIKRPPSTPAAGRMRAPISSLSVTDARIDATIDGVKLATREVDLDVTAEEDDAFEIALRAGRTDVTRAHPFVGREATEDAVDDDVVCRLDARLRAQGRSFTVRRLLLQGAADFDPDPDTRPSCELAPEDWRNVEVRLGAFRLELPENGAPRANGRVHAKVPAGLAHRLANLAHATGSITADLSVDYDGIAKLPRVSGHVSAESPGVDGKVFAKHLDVDVSIAGEKVSASHLVAHWADGVLQIPAVSIAPFGKGMPIESGPVTFDGLELTALLRDLGAHPRAHVAWTLDHGRIDHLKGTLDPVLIEGPIAVSTHGFEVFDRPSVDPLREHMMGVREGTVRGTFAINGMAKHPVYKMPGVVLSNFSVDTPRSHLSTSVVLGFDTSLDIEVNDGSHVELADIAPLGDIPISGRLAFRASGHGAFGHPKITAELGVKDFLFAGLAVGEIESAHAAFEPLTLDLSDVHVRHGASRIRSDHARLSFEKGASVIVDADADTREAPHLRLKDLFEVFHLDKDPRLADVAGVASGKARLHYALGGREDHCGGGRLDIDGSMGLTDISAVGERFDEGTVDFGVTWDDQLAGANGMRLDLRSATLRKGGGTLLARATLRHGGLLQGNAIASGLSLAKIDSLGKAGQLFDGTASMVVDLGGTLNDPEAFADVHLSRLRIGPSSLGPSHLRVGLGPGGLPGGPPQPSQRSAGRTRCNNPRPALPALGDDPSAGVVRVDGKLFDGQLTVSDVRITRQKHKLLAGAIATQNLDLGTLANLLPGVAFSASHPKGSLSAKLDVKSLPLDAPGRAVATLALESLELERDGARVRLARPGGPIRLAGDELEVPDLGVEVKSASGLSAAVTAGGVVHQLVTSPEVDFGVRLEPTDLAKLGRDIPSIERASGALEAAFRVTGKPAALSFAGSAALTKGELEVKGVPVALTDINVEVGISDGDARLKRASAKLGGGVVEVSGRMPLRGADAGAFTANITARGVKLPVDEGVNLTADAQLEASYRPGVDESGRRSVPDLKGTVELTKFSYTRPIALNLNLSQLGRAPRTKVDSYDPANDVVRFNVNLVSPRPLRFSNNLVDMDLEVVSPGLILSGTNQRFGARGLLRILPDSKLQLRSNEFVVREGYVRFDDPLKIAPKVDVRAQTEYRRYAATNADVPAGAAAPESGSPGANVSPVQAAQSTSGSGIWRITLEAHGDADNLKVSLNSDPPLSQEDIVLLLTLGLTRAEIDRGAGASSLGETVGLEALSALTGADKAVKTIVPLIDQFSFGTGYSARTGRSEPTVTVGKRITDSVRASVTTGVSEDREVRSILEWKLNRNISIQGVYDNLNDVSSSPLGNIGADLRFRLEFE